MRLRPKESEMKHASVPAEKRRLRLKSHRSMPCGSGPAGKHRPKAAVPSPPQKPGQAAVKQNAQRQASKSARRKDALCILYSIFRRNARGFPKNGGKAGRPARRPHFDCLRFRLPLRTAWASRKDFRDSSDARTVLRRRVGRHAIFSQAPVLHCREDPAAHGPPGYP